MIFLEKRFFADFCESTVQSSSSVQKGTETKGTEGLSFKQSLTSPGKVEITRLKIS